MANIVKLTPTVRPRHLYWRFDASRFVTLCDDGTVILDGEIMTLGEATSKLLRESGVPPSFFWNK